MGGGGKGETNNIEIYCRVKPTHKQAAYFAYDLPESKVDFNIPRDANSGYVNNQREHYEYKFNGVIPPDAKQDEVFEKVARGAVNGVMEGINCTIFAYGQTGSGKTFTMTGGVERYVDRGLIPRTISTIFSEVAKRSDSQYTVHISYLEIYNETGYDLLDPSQDAKTLEDLPKVSLMEDDEGHTILRNLSMHRANSEEDALNLLFLGDTNRTISETPMNMASSRSHCMFTINVESRKEGGDKVRRSKLHMVDLAGSERVSKTGVDGTTLREAKYINLSLHFLEQVIIALQEIGMGSGRTHIPYRNSMMTMILKDSLGGNCRTSMIATVSMEADQLDESISTCRFALRVAMVSNSVMVNEELDPNLIIKRLKQEVRELKEELRLLKGDDAARGPLTEGEIGRLRQECVAFVNDPSEEAAMTWESMNHVRTAFDLFKQMVLQGGGRQSLQALESNMGIKGKGGSSPSEEECSSPTKAGGGGGGDMVSSEIVKKLRLQVQQRDNEINILVSMLKKAQSASGQVLAGATTPSQSTMDLKQTKKVAFAEGGGGGGGPGGSAAAGSSGQQHPDKPTEAFSADLLADRNKAFEMFRKSYRKNEAIEENKLLLKNKYQEAKTLGESVNAARQRINKLKSWIEQRRMERGMQQVAEGKDPADQPEDAEEEKAKQTIETEKASYREMFNQLRDMKKEIEHLQLLLEQSRTKLQGDFEKWLESMIRQRVSNEAASVSSSQASFSTKTTGSVGHPHVPSHAGVPPPTVTLGTDLSSPVKPAPRQAWGENPGGSGGVAPPVKSSSSSNLQSSNRRPMMTGNPDADADIAAFYEAREKLLKARMSQGAERPS